MTTLRLSVATALLLAVAACSNPETDWQKAETENTEAAYQAFLDKYPQGEWGQQAQARLDALRDERDWENARAADAIEAYNNYLLGHPTGAHMGEARQRIGELELATAWTAAQEAGTKEALEDFLARFPEAPQADQARSQIAALAPPPKPAAKPAPKPAARPASKPAAKAPPAGRYRAQLGAFSSPATAKREKSRLEKRFGDTLGGALTIVNPSGAVTLYRLRSVSMSEQAARALCRKLKGAGQDCVVVAP